MTTLCASCGVRPATARDFLLRDGAWIETDVCELCARRRRAVGPMLGSGLAAVALAIGTTYTIDRIIRASAERGRPPTNDPREWAKRLRPGATPTLAAFSRDLTAAAKAGELDPVIGREDEVERVIAISTFFRAAPHRIPRLAIRKIASISVGIGASSSDCQPESKRRWPAGVV